MININKKVIYISVFLVLALFLISACEAVGRRLPSRYSDNTLSPESTITSSCNIEFSQGIDLLSDNYNKLPLLSNEDKKSLGVANVIHMKSDKANGIKLSKSGLSIQTNEIWLYYREPFTPMYSYAIFYKDSANSNKKSLFTAEPYKEETVSINC